MEKARLAGVLALAVVTAVTVGAEFPKTAAQRQEAAEYRAILEAAPLAQVEGEAQSPNGQFRVETAGRTDQYISGWIVPEFLQVTSTDSGAVLWQDQGWLTQSAAWSPDSRFLALAYSTRTQSGLKVVDTQTWTDWDFTLPDGSPIPEYVFFPENWGTWLDMDTLLLTVGRGGDAGESHTYRCSMTADEGGQLTGSVLEETAEVLLEDYDFDHDGVPETTELVTVGEPGGGNVAWYELRIIRQDGQELRQEPYGAGPLALTHPGYGSVFAIRLWDKDLLLILHPTMYQGWAEYGYEVVAFYQEENGEWGTYLCMKDAVAFDTNFGREGHQFDAGRIAEFFWHLREYLQNSTVLVSTENGEFQTGIPGLELQNYMFGDLLSLDSLASMEAAVLRQEAEMKAAQGAA